MEIPVSLHIKNNEHVLKRNGFFIVVFVTTNCNSSFPVSLSQSRFTILCVCYRIKGLHCFPWAQHLNHIFWGPTPSQAGVQNKLVILVLFAWNDSSLMDIWAFKFRQPCKDNWSWAGFTSNDLRVLSHAQLPYSHSLRSSNTVGLLGIKNLVQ